MNSSWILLILVLVLQGPVEFTLPAPPPEPLPPPLVFVVAPPTSPRCDYKRLIEEAAKHCGSLNVRNAPYITFDKDGSWGPKWAPLRAWCSYRCEVVR